MTDDGIATIWVYLSTTPLLGLTITLVAYGIAYRAYLWSGSNPLLHPVVSAVTLLILFLVGTDTPYEAYFAGRLQKHEMTQAEIDAAVALIDTPVIPG